MKCKEKNSFEVASKRRSLEKRFDEMDASLNELMDENPKEAISVARSLVPDEVFSIVHIEKLKAGILVDAGAVGKDKTAVDEGVEILRRHLKGKPNEADLQYCLANGISAQADLIPYSGHEWFLDTADLRREARYLFQMAGMQVSIPEIASRALTNLGNLLLKSYRFVEAYDSYMRGIELDPTNGVALSGAARVLLRFAGIEFGEGKALLAVAAKHMKAARENPERIRGLVGPQSFREIMELLEMEVPAGESPDLTCASDYQKYVAKHRLALTPTIEGLDLSLRRWDSLRLGSISDAVQNESGVPPLFAMFNIIKSEYLTARFLAYSALNGKFPESGKYADTLDYALYGIRPSLLTISQKSCMDLLDKIAISASEYLNLPGSSNAIYFTTRWFTKAQKGDPQQWEPHVAQEIKQGNSALIALSEVSLDIAAGGYLQMKKKIRHASTHRFIVLHDLGCTPSRECRHIEHYDENDFIAQLIETLQLARAVLFYFVEMIRIQESREAKKKNLRLPLFVPDHDWIRGERED